MNTETYNNLPTDVKEETNITINESIPTGMVRIEITDKKFVEMIRRKRKQHRQNINNNRHRK